MKKQRVKRILVVTIIFSWMISMFSGMKVSAMETFDIPEIVTTNEEKTEATIAFDSSVVDPMYTVQQITNPDGTIMDVIKQPVYTVNTNGTYVFHIQYLENNTEVKEYVKEVTVTTLQEAKVEEKENSGVLKPAPRTIVSPKGDSLTVQFNRTGGTPIDWSGVSTLDWSFYKTEQIEIQADFSEVGTNKARTIEVDIPDGYQILAYSAKAGTSAVAGEQVIATTSVVDQALLSSQLTSQNGGIYGSEYIDTYYNASATTVGTLMQYRLRSGKVLYTFNNTAETVILTLQIGIDRPLYNYHDTREEFAEYLGTTSLGISTGDVFEDMRVSLVSGTEELEETVAANVKGRIDLVRFSRSGTTDGDVDATYINDSGDSAPFYPFGKGQTESYGVSGEGSGQTTNVFFDEAILTMYYPEGAIYQGMNYSKTKIPAENITVDHDPVTRTLTITMKNIYTTGIFVSPYPEFILDGDIYGESGSGKLTSATFSGKLSYKAKEADSYLVIPFTNYKTTINDVNQPATITGYNSQSFDYYGDGYRDLNSDGKQDGYQFLGSFVVRNPSILKKENLPLQWSFSKELGVKIVRFGTTPNYQMGDITVYTNQNPTGYEIPASDLANLIFDGDAYGFTNDEYITNIVGTIAVVNAYLLLPVDNVYKTSGFSAYGIYTEGTGGTQTLTIDGIPATLQSTPTTDRLVSPGAVTVQNLSTTYYPGSSIPIKMRYAASSATYSYNKTTEDFIVDPNVYIRVPEGFGLDETSVKFLFDNKDITAKGSIKSITTMPDGATVYKYSFDDPYTVLAGIQTKNGTGAYNQTKYFNVEFNLKVSPNNQGYANLPIRDIIMLETKDGNFVTGTSVRNDDFGITEEGHNLLVPLTTVTTNVVKLPELQVTSGIRTKDSGTDFYTYDGTNSTIAALSSDKKAEVEISYYNNAPNRFTNAAIYFPIPKAGKDYGKYFNNMANTDPANQYVASPFSWSANISSEINVPGFTTYYAIDATTNTSDYLGGLDWEPITTTKWYTYAELIAAGKTVSDVVFLKFDNLNTIESKETGSFTFELEADENSPVDTISYWRTYTGAQTEGSANNSWVYGSILAGTLSIGKIEGQVFVDRNGNGIYDVGTDSIFTGSTLQVNLSEKTGKIGTTILAIDPVTGRFAMDMLKEGEYSLSAINTASTKYHFTKNTEIAPTGITNNVINNATHSQAKVDGLIINADTSPEITNLGIGLIENSPATFLFESKVANDSILTGVSMNLDSTTIDKTGSISYDQLYYLEEYPIEPTVSVPLGYTHVGWNVYVNGIKQGNTIPKGDLTTTKIALVAPGATYEIKAVVGYPPAVTVATLNVYTGDTADLLAGMTATTADGEAIVLIATVGILKNTEITAPNGITSDGKYVTRGTYQVTYTVTDVKTGAYTTVTRIIKINEAPTVVALPQQYTEGDTGILTGVINNPTASWVKAGDSVGSTASQTAIAGPAVAVATNNTISYSITSGPSSDFSVEGIYEVTYTATNPDGKVGTKTVEVLLVNSTSVSDGSGDVSIDAEGFTIPNAQASGLTETLAKDSSHGNSRAYFTERDSSDVVTGYTDITSNITVNTTELTAIQGAPTTGGIYPLTYTVTEDGKTVSKTVNVIVEGTRTPPPEETTTGDSLTITGKDYTLTNVAAKALTSSDSITLGTVKAMLVQAGTNVTNITVNATELAAIKATGANGGSYPLTYTATHTDGTNISVTLTVTVLGSVVPPVITTIDQAYYVGDSVNLLEGVSAKEYDNVTMTLEEGSNVTITSTIPTLAGTYTTPGTYEVTYVVEDSRGITATETKIIKVHGLPVVSATPQKYTVGDSTIVTSVTNNPTASYLQAGATVGSVPTATPITGITNTIISGPSSDYSVEGIYEVTYTATNPDGKVGTKTVEVLIVDSNSVSDSSGDVSIDAEGFTIPNAQAAGLTETLAKDSTHGNSSAYYTERDSSDVVTGYTDISSQVTVNTTELTAIQGAPTTGGIYPLTYTVTEDGKTVSKTVTVVVEGTRTPPPEETTTGDSLTITGKDYTLTNVNAKALTDAEAIIQGTVKAMLVQAGTNVTNITVNATELAAIKAVGANGGSYPLTYTATHTDGTDISVTLTVTVLGSVVPPVITTVDQAYYVGDSVNLLEGVSAKEYDNVTMTLEEGSNVTITSTIPTLAGKYTTPGTYEVSYEVEDSRGITATDTKIIKVHGLPVIEASPQEYQLGDDILTGITNHPTASWLKASDIVGNNAIETRIVGPATLTGGNDTITYAVTDGPSSDFSTTGIYEVNYIATNPDGKVVQKTVQVLVVAKETEIDTTNTIQIFAEGFVLENAEAKGLTEIVALDYGNAEAYFTNKEAEKVTGYKDITNQITVDQRQLEEIRNTGVEGGIYDLIYTVKEDGLQVTKAVKVVVLGTRTPTPQETTDGDTLAITAKDIHLTQNEAQQFITKQAKEVSEVQAWLMKIGEQVTDIYVEPEQLASIQAVGSNGGVFDLTFTATYTDSEGKITKVSTTIKVTVDAENTLPEGNQTASRVDTSDTTNIYGYSIVLVVSVLYLGLRKYRFEK